MKRLLVFLSVVVLLAGIADGVLQWEKYALQSTLYTSRQQAYQQALLQEASVSPTATPVPHRPDLATGITFPQWGPGAYSSQDTNWERGLQEIKQLHARWIALTLPFRMAGPQATQIQTRKDTPTTQAFQEGIEKAHQFGLQVLVMPLITLNSPPGWAGNISFSSEGQARAWFASYWQVLQPYIRILAQERGEMLSLGSEYDRLQDESPDQ